MIVSGKEAENHGYMIRKLNILYQKVHLILYFGIINV